MPVNTLGLFSLRARALTIPPAEMSKFKHGNVTTLTINITHRKKGKMVKTIDIYCDNRNQDELIEEIDEPAPFHKLKSINLMPEQTEVKIDLMLPSKAFNLMIAFPDFYTKEQASPDAVICPCGLPVADDYGNCPDCRQNVFQCPNCRIFRADGEIPFLCHNCGYSKYSKFQISVDTRACSLKDKISGDGDCKRAVSNIKMLIEESNQIYRQLIANKPTTVLVTLRMNELRYVKLSAGLYAPSYQHLGGVMDMNQLMQVWEEKPKTLWEELIKIVQLVVVYIRKLIDYDRVNGYVEQPRAILCLNPSRKKEFGNSHFYQSLTAIRRCLSLLKMLIDHSVIRQEDATLLIPSLVWSNLRSGGIINRKKLTTLLGLLTNDCVLLINKDELMSRIALTFYEHSNSFDLNYCLRQEMWLLGPIAQTTGDPYWGLKIYYLIKLFVHACKSRDKPMIMDLIIIPCLKIFCVLMKGNTKLTMRMIRDGHSLNIDEFVGDGPIRPLADQPKFADTGYTRHHLLDEIYSRKLEIFQSCNFSLNNLSLSFNSWVRTVIFCRESSLPRRVICDILNRLYGYYGYKNEVLKLLLSFLLDVAVVGEKSSQFLSFFKALTTAGWHSKRFLIYRGAVTILIDVITYRIDQLRRLESFSSEANPLQGLTLYQVTDILRSFMQEDSMKCKSRTNMCAILDEYLSLKMLNVQKSEMTDSAQRNLFDILIDIAAGHEEELLDVFVRRVEECSYQDSLTPYLILECLYTVLSAGENAEFSIYLIKDLNHRVEFESEMIQNPYSSLQIDMGPLMRDVRNKICEDCRLEMLMKVGYGIELLVHNKIINLDLRVADVYKNVWLEEGGSREIMTIVYRLRGLYADASEAFVESITEEDNFENNEELSRKIAILEDCGGFQIMISRMDAIGSVVMESHLVKALLNLFQLCANVERGQMVLIKPKYRVMGVLLNILKMCLLQDTDIMIFTHTKQVLDVIVAVFSAASRQCLEEYLEFRQTVGSSKFIKSLMTYMLESSLQYSTILTSMTTVLAGLTYTNEEYMKILMDYFESVLHFDQFDIRQTEENRHKLEMFCILCSAIEKNAIGNTLKDYIVRLNIAQNALDYIKKHAPSVDPTLLITEIDELRHFASRPALNYILSFLTGLTHNHEVSQVVPKSPMLPQVDDVDEDPSLVCRICREGYIQCPEKVLGIYIFTKQCDVEEFETTPTKTIGHTTVSHFNIVHFDCHLAAINLTDDDEWDAAQLHNTYTKCNGLLPIFAPENEKSDFDNVLARHNMYLMNSTGIRINHLSAVHDIKLLLLRFAEQKPFHIDTHGGGPQHNMHIIPYLIHLALFLIEKADIAATEDRNLMQYLENKNPADWVESAYKADGPLYWITLSLLLHSPRRWNALKLSHLHRIAVLAHVRYVSLFEIRGSSRAIQDREVKVFSIYKPYFLFFALIDGIYENFFKTVPGSDEEWTTSLAEYIRNNHEELLKSTVKLMTVYYDELLPCQCFTEFFFNTGLLDDIRDPERYMRDLVDQLPVVARDIV